MEENAYKFLKDYEKLCQKYKMSISACGCCDSPFLIDDNDKYVLNIANVNYNKKHKKVLIGRNYFDDDNDTKTIDEYFKENGWLK